jgi:hypothetical protein
MIRLSREGFCFPCNGADYRLTPGWVSTQEPAKEGRAAHRRYLFSALIALAQVFEAAGLCIVSRQRAVCHLLHDGPNADLGL